MCPQVRTDPTRPTAAEAAPQAVVLDQFSLYVDGRCFLHRVDLTVAEGETLVVAGPAGSGKSFVLRAAMGMPGVPHGETVEFEGDVRVLGHALWQLAPHELQGLRMRLGSVMLGGGLIDNMDVRRNIALPLQYHFADVLSASQIQARCTALLAAVGHGHLDRPGIRPVNLNREERVYVALARALINQPHLLLFDDPAAGLSPGAAGRLVEFLFHRPRFEDGAVLHDEPERQVTRLIATTDLADYLPWGDRFAVLSDHELRLLGDRQAVLESDDPCVDDLLSPRGRLS